MFPFLTIAAGGRRHCDSETALVAASFGMNSSIPAELLASKVGLQIANQ
jgi:hypothetical protein